MNTDLRLTRPRRSRWIYCFVGALGAVIALDAAAGLSQSRPLRDSLNNRVA